MSRKIVTTINRFDGGITDDIRSGDYSKCAHVSHFDIYTDKNRLIQMPGYVADQNTVAGGADDLQNYNIKAFDYNSGTFYCVGTKSNGTGTKFFSKATAETASWTAETGGEGTYDLADNTHLDAVSSSGRLYCVTNNGGNTYLSYLQLGGGPVTDGAATLATSITTLPTVLEYGFDDTHYLNTGADDVASISGGTVTDPAKDTAIYVTDIQSGDEQIGIMGYRFYPYKSQLLLWDSGSSLIDQKIEFGTGRESVLGNPSGVWVAAISENLISSTAFDDEANGRYDLVIKRAALGGAREMVRLSAATNTNGALKPIREKYKGAMLFYARIPQDATPTTYKEGVWAVGQNQEDSPLALSLLLDTSGLGSMEGVNVLSKHFFFAHGGDGSVSRLDAFDDGTFDVDAEYQTLMFGSDTPNLKELNGVGVLTEDLPSGASVTAYYRFDEDDSWTSLGSSSTTGDEKHQFTRPSGVSIGKFREIQFRIVVSGGVDIKSIIVSIEELDDLGFNI